VVPEALAHAAGDKHERGVFRGGEPGALSAHVLVAEEPQALPIGHARHHTLKPALAALRAEQQRARLCCCCLLLILYMNDDGGE
jgi:hypothetical protein